MLNIYVEIDAGLSLDDSLSPQFKAYAWLVGKDRPLDGLESLTDIQLLQRYGMATLYFSLAGHGWTDQENWLTTEDVCKWENVEECNSAEMVTFLELYSNNLVGRIPVEISHIRMLGTCFLALEFLEECLLFVAQDLPPMRNLF